jgi:stearoyl-CoA desaturase (delta-9 desaturase)
VAPTGSGGGRRLSQFAHAYIGWMFDPKSLKPRGWERMTPDMFRRPDLFRLHVSYAKWGVLGLVIPAILSGAWYQSWQGLLSGFLWGGLLRVFVANHMYYVTNSFGHLVGTRPFRRKDNSRNNMLLAIPTLGLSLHNNHHEFPASASVSLHWWQPDISALVIRILEVLGLVWEVRRPTPEQIREARQRYIAQPTSGEKEA